MKIRLHEIEYGSLDKEQSKNFYQAIFGFEPVIDQPNLAVFNLETSDIDLNVSEHIPANSIRVSYLTDDLNEVIERLTSNSIPFKGPEKWHLGMTSIEFSDPNGYIIRVNQPGADSPEGLII
ncbi:MAG: hypothetical protein EOO90_05025 [Pedobacter sp.]|nr:MAG: hypothetical protein EOO90_05025 [Pedobacter sp.]